MPFWHRVRVQCLALNLFRETAGEGCTVTSVEVSVPPEGNLIA
jgi:hypothetical protein